MPTRVKHPSDVFVTDDEIPVDLRCDASDAGLNYLIAGEVQSWSGPSQAVPSPLCVSQKKDVCQVQIRALPAHDGKGVA
jgi:hypothetical protein